jgi:hypothetical protein
MLSDSSRPTPHPAAAPIAVNGERREKRRFSNGEDFLVALQRRLA